MYYNFTTQSSSYNDFSMLQHVPTPNDLTDLCHSIVKTYYIYPKCTVLYTI